MTHLAAHTRIVRHVASLTARAKFLETVDLGVCKQSDLIRQIAACDRASARILMGDIGEPQREIELEPLEEPLTAPVTVPESVPSEPAGV